MVKIWQRLPWMNSKSFYAMQKRESNDSLFQIPKTPIGEYLLHVTLTVR